MKAASVRVWLSMNAGVRACTVEGAARRLLRQTAAVADEDMHVGFAVQPFKNYDDWKAASHTLMTLAERREEEDQAATREHKYHESASQKRGSKSFEPLEEQQVAEEDGRDLAILTTVDGALLDDEALRVTMKPAIARTRDEPKKATNFALGALQRRLPGLLSFDQESWLPRGRFPVRDLSGLTSQAWEAIADIACGAVEREVASYKGKGRSLPYSGMYGKPPWMDDAFCILTSRAITPLNGDILRAFGEICRTHKLEFNPRRRMELSQDIPFPELWAHFTRVLSWEFEDPERALRWLSRLFDESYAKRVAEDEPSPGMKVDIIDIVSPLLQVPRNLVGVRDGVRYASLTIFSWIPHWAWPLIEPAIFRPDLTDVKLIQDIKDSAVLTALALQYLVSIPSAELDSSTWPQ